MPIRSSDCPSRIRPRRSAPAEAVTSRTPGGDPAPPRAGKQTPAAGFSLLMVNYLPFLYVLLGAGLGAWQHVGWPQTIVFTLSWLYLVPPLAARVLIWRFGAPNGVHPARDTAFLHWWLLTQLQVIYSRFPATEELLRLVPGLYSAWLCLWGSRVSPFVYWSPGVIVMDRYHLQIGPRVVIAPGARIGAHVVQTFRDGDQLLTVAPLRIDAGAMVGIMAAVGPGCHVHAHETVPPRKFLRPFVTWKDGAGHAPRSAPGGNRPSRDPA